MSIISTVTETRGDTSNPTIRVRIAFTDHIGFTDYSAWITVPTYASLPVSPQNNENTIYSIADADAFYWNGSWVTLASILIPGKEQERADREYDQQFQELTQNGTDIFSIPAVHQTDETLYVRICNEIITMDYDTLCQHLDAIPPMDAQSNPTVTGWGYNWTEWNNWMSSANTAKVARDNHTPMAAI